MSITMSTTAKGFLVFSWLAIAGPAVFAQPKIEAVVNAASFQPGLPKGGALATLFVSGLDAPRLNTYPGTYVADWLPLPYELGGIQVTICGFTHAPIRSVSIPPRGSQDYVQINFQVPLERNVVLLRDVLACDLTVTLVGPLGTSASLSPLPQPSFGGFFADTKKYVIAQHAYDYSLVTPDNPASAGEAIVSYANDFFTVWPEPPMGLLAPGEPTIAYVPGATYPGFIASLYLQPIPPYTPPDTITHQGGGYFPTTPPLKTTFLGLAPGQIGVEQVNFVVPANQQPGDWPLFFSGGIPGPYVLLPVR